MHDILHDAPRLVALGLSRGWIGRRNDPVQDWRRNNGKPGFQAAKPDSDPEMVEFRRARGLSQAQAAAMCGVSSNVWSNAERKTRRRTFALPV